MTLHSTNVAALASTGTCLNRGDSALDQLSDDSAGSKRSNHGCYSMPIISEQQLLRSQSGCSSAPGPPRYRRAMSSRNASSIKIPKKKTSFRSQRTASASSLSTGIGSQSLGQKLERDDSTSSQSSDAGRFDADEVFPGLWVGGLSAAQDSKRLIQRSIWSVVTVASRLKPAIAWLCSEASSIQITNIDIEDHPLANILGALPEALKAIDSLMKSRAQGSKVACLVHCASGISRSVTACVVWLMLRQELPLARALQMVTARRIDANPNSGFMQSLKLLDEQTGDSKQRLRQAQSLWKKANNEKHRDSAVQKMRKVADRLSERACVIEEMLAQQLCMSAESLEKQKLEKLLADIEAAGPAHCIDDNLAQSVRTAAEQKVRRLLKKLESAERSATLAHKVFQKHKLPQAMTASLEDYIGAAPIPRSRKINLKMFQQCLDEELLVTL